MREAIGGTWLFGLVITFIVFFASFLAISVNYSRAFNVKNNVVDLISKYEGNNCKAREKISSYLSDVGYLVPHKCDSGYTGYDLEGNDVGEKKAYYCIYADETDDALAMKKKFYRVEVFFRIDLPVIGDIATFKIKGETESIPFYKEDNLLSC